MYSSIVLLCSAVSNIISPPHIYCASSSFHMCPQHQHILVGYDHVLCSGITSAHRMLKNGQYFPYWHQRYVACLDIVSSSVSSPSIRSKFLHPCWAILWPLMKLMVWKAPWWIHDFSVPQHHNIWLYIDYQFDALIIIYS